MKKADNMNQDEYKSMFEVEQTHWWYIGLRQMLFYWIKKIHPKTILDAGCGTGINQLLLQQQHYQIDGIDYSDLAVKFSKARGIKNVKQGMIQKLTFPDAHFDLIYSLDVLGILTPADSQLALQEFSRCLKPGGSLILNVAALQWLYSQHDVACHLIHRYNQKEIVAILKKNGFSIKKISYRVFFLFPLVAFIKIIEKFQLKNVKDSEVTGDLKKTNSIFNLLLKPMMWLEFQTIKLLNLPWGTSLWIVAEKNQ
ncbi:MAG: methyltransferase domain-containing protein [bacterium]